MIGPRVAVDNNVVDVPYREGPLHTAQEPVHHSLEEGGTRGETERQSALLALTIRCYEAGLRCVLLVNLHLVKSVTHAHDGEVTLAREGGQNLVRARQGLLRDHDMLVNIQAPDDFRTITTAEPHCPTPGSVIPLASKSGIADRTIARMEGDSRRGGNEIGGVLPVSKRAFSKLVADNGLVPSLNRSLNSWRTSRKSESSPGVRQLLREGRGGTKLPSSVIS